MGCTLMKIDMPIVRVFFRKLKKITPEYTMYAGCRGDVPKYCSDQGYRRVLIVTDGIIRRLGLIDKTIEGLKSAALNIPYLMKSCPILSLPCIKHVGESLVPEEKAVMLVLGHTLK